MMFSEFFQVECEDADALKAKFYFKMDIAQYLVYKNHRLGYYILSIY